MKFLGTLSTTLILELLFPLVTLQALYAQTPSTVPADNTAAAGTTAPSRQAPDEMTKKITDLVHAGKYAEAQQLTNGLLIAYPDDQRLIKAKALIDKLLAPGGSTGATPATSQPAQPAADANAAQLTGMDKVDYEALVILAKQAQTTTDLGEQTKQLKQFMDQSSEFLQKHPEQMQLWQLRAASAMILNDPMAGYDAGQKLIISGAADSGDPNVLQLLGQLKNKGWLNQNEAEKHAKHDWVLGNWNMDVSLVDKGGKSHKPPFSTTECSMSSLIIDCNLFDKNHTNVGPYLRGTVLDSGEIRWERRWGTEWKPVTVEIGNDKQTMKVIYSQDYKILGECTYTGIFSKK